MPIPVKSIDDFFVDASAFNEFDVITVARPDGRFFVGETDETSGPGVFTRRFSADADSFNIRSHANQPAVIEEQIGAAALESGFEVFAWAEGPAGSKDIYAEVRGASGSVITSRFLVDGAAGSQVRPEVVGLGGDRFAVVWIDSDTDRYRFAIHDVGGNVVSAADDVSVTPTSGLVPGFRQADLAELDNGSFVVAYRPIIGSQSDAVFRIFDRNGNAQTAEINIDGLSTALGPPSVAKLADGRFVAMNGGGTEARIFDADGLPSTGLFPVLSDGTLPQIAAPHDGRFVVAAAIGTGDIIARVMFADGTPDGAEFTVNTVPTGTSGLNVGPSIATLADGRVVVPWTTNESGDFDVKAAVFDPREQRISASATSFDDDWIGTAFGDTLFMGVGDDTAQGSGGSDFMFGEAGRDFLVGDEGDDRLNGGTGADLMSGGQGNDFYFVDSTTDFTSEASGEGIDSVRSTVSVSLGANVEKLYLAGAALVGSGNALVNFIFGNAEGNSLDGLGGADRMFGGNGDDIYGVDSSGDIVTESTAGATGGNDTVFSRVNFTLGANVENLTLIDAANVNGTGNTLANQINGNSGNNFIDGKAGNDALSGGGGSDQYLFTTALNPATNVDTITGFDGANDFLRLDDAIFSVIATGFLAGTAFELGSAADTAGDRIIYNPATGEVFYDPDGVGGAAQVKFAVLAGGPALGAADIFVF